MTYMLEKDGDYYERRYWNTLKESFPNYEVMWSRFIVPLTSRAEGKGIGLKAGTSSLLESISMIHYTVFYHFGVAFDLHERLGHEFAEDILFHLSSSTEMVERLIFSFAKLKANLQGVELAASYTEKNIFSTIERYVLSKEYSKAFELFIRRGQSVNVRLHNPADVTTEFMLCISNSAAKEFHSWQTTAIQIRHYRNTLAHNPRLGTLLNTDDEIFVPKEAELSRYELWSSFPNRSGNNDFVLLSDLLENFSAELIEKTNMLWNYLISFMDETANKKEYIQLCGGGPLILSTDQSSHPNPPYVSMSGTYSFDPTASSID